MKITIYICLGIMVFCAVGLAIIGDETPAPEANGPVACTMDAKVCPDGSAVGRTGPNCEFAKCPGEVK